MNVKWMQTTVHFLHTTRLLEYCMHNCTRIRRMNIGNGGQGRITVFNCPLWIDKNVNIEITFSTWKTVALLLANRIPDNDNLVIHTTTSSAWSKNVKKRKGNQIFYGGHDNKKEQLQIAQMTTNEKRIQSQGEKGKATPKHQVTMKREKKSAVHCSYIIT